MLRERHDEEAGEYYIVSSSDQLSRIRRLVQLIQIALEPISEDLESKLIFVCSGGF